MWTTFLLSIISFLLLSPANSQLKKNANRQRVTTDPNSFKEKTSLSESISSKVIVSNVKPSNSGTAKAQNAYLNSLFKNVRGPHNEFTLYNLETHEIEKKHPELYKSFITLRASIQLTEADYKLAITLSNELLLKEPQWLDGLWFAAGYQISFAEWNMRHQNKEKALELFETAHAHMEECLKREPHHPICLFLMSASLARLASIKGIATSIQKGREILKDLQEVTSNKVNLRFQDHNPRSLQGAAYHGLGIFYRVVPQSWLLKFFLGFSGDLDQSEISQRRAIEIDGPVSAYATELAVTLLCQNEKKADPKKVQEADELLSKVEKIESPLPMDHFYAANAKKLRNNLSMGCHFMFGKSSKPLSEEALKTHLK